MLPLSTETSASPRLRVPSANAWRDFVALLDLLISDEYRDQPAKQIALILERGYEQYLLENYENADSRAEDIRGLALYAQRYDSTETFLSELALALHRTIRRSTAADRRRCDRGR